MTHILLPDTVSADRRLVFYLAMEEFVAEHLDELIPADEEGAFFLWQSRPTVIIGKHQDVEAEVNLPWCREHGVDVCRRKSGGGCVYSDSGNQMISCILRDTNAQRAFGYYLERLVDNLSALGLPAVTSTHNDVMIGDRKVSGNASFARPTATIHAVQSVRQRVTNLWDMGIRDLSALQQHLISRFSQPSGRTVTLTEADVRVIEQIETTYVL